MQTSPYESPATAEDAVLGTLMALGRRMRQRLPEDTLDFSVVPVLKTLGTCGPMRLSSLAEALELDASTVSRHVKQLEDRGFLGRTTDPDDGRASRIEVTDAGREAFTQHIGRRRDIVAAALEDWDDADRDSLRALLDRLNRRIASS
ncbi:MAG TPA: MarR family transcriptional regulator [Nocardioidaceae bacterium]|nr:MarR family transcriptional regulator [Nocardioidaceae bacterium]